MKKLSVQSERDIEEVMKCAGVNRRYAICACITIDNDIVNALMYLQFSNG